MAEAVHDVTWLADYSSQEDVVFRIGRRGNEVIAEWSGIARLIANRDGTNARLLPMEGVSADDLTKIRTGSAVVLLRHLEGKLALHGAVVGERGRAVMLLGRSGQGKSTLAAALCVDGATLYSDDAIAIDPDPQGGWRVHPMERNHWLDARAQEVLTGCPTLDGDDQGKWALPTRSVASESAVVSAIVDLRFAGDRAMMRRVTGIDAMGALVPQVVRFALDDSERHRREIEMLTALVSDVPTFQLDRPRDFALLRDAVRLVRQLLGSST